MARIEISEAVHGPLITIANNGKLHSYTAGTENVVDLDVLSVLDHANIIYERIYRTQNVALAALTLDNAVVTDAAALADVVGAVVGSSSGSTLAMTNDASGLFALSGLNVVVAGALTAGSKSIQITETNEEIYSSPRATTITITVNTA